MQWFYNLGLAKKLTLTLVVVLSFSILMGVFSIIRLSKANGFTTELAEQWVPKNVILGNLAASCEKLRGLELKHIAFSTKADRDQAEQEIGAVLEQSKKDFTALEPLISTPEEKALLAGLRQSWAGFLEQHDRAMQASRLDKDAEAMAICGGAARVSFDKTRGLIDGYIGLAAKKTAAVNSESRETCATTRNLIIVLMAASLIFGLWLTYFIVHKVVCRSLWWALKSLERVADGDLTQNIKVKSTEEIGQIFTAIKKIVEKLREFSAHVNELTHSLGSSSTELLSTTEQMNRSTHEQAGQTDHVASAVMEMSQTFIDVASTAEGASTASKETSEAAQEGYSTVAEVMKEMDTIVSSMEASSVTIGKLGQSSRKIGDIVATIEEVADMTNLLALNAAIEAARAGDHGRGFAVVADEVRALAERTGKATKEIDAMIKAIQHDTAQAVTSMMASRKQADEGLLKAQEASRALGRIVEASGKSMDMIQLIAAATEEQSAVAGQVSTSVELIANGTRSSESAAEHIQESAHNLAQFSQELEEAATWFKVA